MSLTIPPVLIFIAGLSVSSGSEHSQDAGALKANPHAKFTRRPTIRFSGIAQTWHKVGKYSVLKHGKISPGMLDVTEETFFNNLLNSKTINKPSQL